MKDHLRTAFRDDVQLADVCKVLCEHASVPGMWTAGYGPTTEGERVLSRDCAGLSAGQQIIFLAAWELWDEKVPDREFRAADHGTNDGPWLRPTCRARRPPTAGIQQLRRGTRWLPARHAAWLAAVP